MPSTSSLVAAAATAAAFGGAASAILWMRTKLNDLVLNTRQTAAEHKVAAIQMGQYFAELREKVRQAEHILTHPDMPGRGIIAPNALLIDSNRSVQEREAALNERNSAPLAPLAETGSSEIVLSNQHEIEEAIRNIYPASAKMAALRTPSKVPDVDVPLRVIGAPQLDTPFIVGRALPGVMSFFHETERSTDGNGNLPSKPSLSIALQKRIAESLEPGSANSEDQETSTLNSPKRLSDGVLDITMLSNTGNAEYGYHAHLPQMTITTFETTSVEQPESPSAIDLEIDNAKSTSEASTTAATKDRISARQVVQDIERKERNNLFTADDKPVLFSACASLDSEKKLADNQFASSAELVIPHIAPEVPHDPSVCIVAQDFVESSHESSPSKLSMKSSNKPNSSDEFGFPLGKKDCRSTMSSAAARATEAAALAHADAIEKVLAENKSDVEDKLLHATGCENLESLIEKAKQLLSSRASLDTSTLQKIEEYTSTSNLGVENATSSDSTKEELLLSSRNTPQQLTADERAYTAPSNAVFTKSRSQTHSLANNTAGLAVAQAPHPGFYHSKKNEITARPTTLIWDDEMASFVPISPADLEGTSHREPQPSTVRVPAAIPEKLPQNHPSRMYSPSEKIELSTLDKKVNTSPACPAKDTVQAVRSAPGSSTHKVVAKRKKKHSLSATLEAHGHKELSQKQAPPKFSIFKHEKPNPENEFAFPLGKQYCRSTISPAAARVAKFAALAYLDAIEKVDADKKSAAEHKLTLASGCESFEGWKERARRHL